ncbi:MAG: phosphoenolpyruvate--protein phosphotransferase, partial [Polyangiaceae bacterium]|nr:phosphoenolpyruvate--protein phosphotransferase [Polyangiaceae bacterium]
IAACPGVAVGPVRVLDRRGHNVVRYAIRARAISTEIERLEQAVTSSVASIEEVRRALEASHGPKYAALLDPHVHMHGDAMLLERARAVIETEHLNAEWAVRSAVDALKQPLLCAEQPYFRERAEDIEQVGQHILRALRGDRPDLPEPDDPVVIVATDLSPADAAALWGTSVVGLVTERGSATSHTAILARALGIPAVVGVPHAAQRSVGAQMVIVDGVRGELVLDPGRHERTEATSRGERFRSFTRGLRAQSDAQIGTEDGHGVELWANVELPPEAQAAAKADVPGIGLFRTEFLYLNRTRPPGEDEQAEVYGRVVADLGGRPVVFRTFDFGGDKFLRFRPIPPGPNPALGLCGIRFSLAVPDLLRAQLRALLRASASGPVRVLFPRVGSLDELLAAKAVLAECAAELEREGYSLAPVPVGTMIEIPSAALTAERLAKHCDFFSVGTNDLVQYTLAVDRSDPAVARFSRALDPAVVFLLDRARKAASEQGIPITMCGDMAGDAIALPLLLGLGYDRLSIPLGTRPFARAAVRRVSMSEARALAAEALEQDSAEAVRSLVIERFSDALGELWDAQGVGKPSSVSVRSPEQRRRLP